MPNTLIHNSIDNWSYAVSSTRSFYSEIEQNGIAQDHVFSLAAVFLDCQAPLDADAGTVHLSTTS